MSEEFKEMKRLEARLKKKFFENKEDVINNDNKSMISDELSNISNLLLNINENVKNIVNLMGNLKIFSYNNEFSQKKDVEKIGKKDEEFFIIPDIDVNSSKVKEKKKN